jgi:hypothetical protein
VSSSLRAYEPDLRPTGGSPHVDSGARMTYSADRQQILNTFGDWCSKIHLDPAEGQTSVGQRISAILESRHGDVLQVEQEELPVFCGRNDVSIRNTCRDFRKTEM